MPTASFKTLLLILCMSVLSGCATLTANNHPHDPFEPVNRKIFAFNDTVDHYIYKPVAKTYDAILPSPVKVSVHNFYRNVEMLPTIANDLMQFKLFRATEGSLRFLINTTVGIGGLFDPATPAGLHFQHEDFGLTLAFWGWEGASYMVIPLLGPSTTRDTIGFFAEERTIYPLAHVGEKSFRDKLYLVRGTDIRYQLLDADKLLDDALDKYSMQRDAYLQHREKEILENKGEHVQDTYVE